MSDRLQQILEKTLDDGRLTRNEKKALQKVLSDLPSPTDLHQVRLQAFELARQTLRHPEQQKTLEWLWEVIKLTLPSEEEKDREISAHFTTRHDCCSRIISLLKGSIQSVDICVFTITDNRISSVIAETHRRGIPLRIITDNDKTCDLGSDIDELHRQGIPVKIDNSPSHMHHKFAIFDRARLLTGSYNWTRSAREQQENFLITTHSQAIREYQAEFDHLWEELSDYEEIFGS